MSEENFEGLVVKSQSGFFEVQIGESRSVTCELRGRLKQGARTGDILAVGDRVQIKGLSVAGNEIVVEMVTHGPDDAMCCPTQDTVQTYALEGQELVKTSG